MLTVPLALDEDSMRIDALLFDEHGEVGKPDSHIVTMEYRHYAPRTTVFHGSLDTLGDGPIPIGTSKSLRGRVGSFFFSTDVQNRTITVRMIWKTESAVVCHHDVRLSGRGIVIVPEIFTYE